MIPIRVLVLGCLVVCLLGLRLRGARHALAESPEELTGLTEEEGQIKTQLSLVNLQIAAINKTLADNLYIPYLES